MSKGGSGRSKGGGGGGSKGGFSMGGVRNQQSYIEEYIVREKQSNKDYDVQIAPVKDGRKTVWVVVDGNHSLEAARRDNVKPNFVKVNTRQFKTYDEYRDAYRV